MMLWNFGVLALKWGNCELDGRGFKVNVFFALSWILGTSSTLFNIPWVSFLCDLHYVSLDLLCSHYCWKKCCFALRYQFNFNNLPFWNVKRRKVNRRGYNNQQRDEFSRKYSKIEGLYNKLILEVENLKNYKITPLQLSTVEYSSWKHQKNRGLQYCAIKYVN